MTNDDSTSNEDLRELVEEWRYRHELPVASAERLEIVKAFRKCADELEAVIDDD